MKQMSNQLKAVNLTLVNDLDLKQIPLDITEDDVYIFDQITRIDLTEEQIKEIIEPQKIYPLQRNVLAVHWHPEHVPIELALKRVEKMFPNKQKELIIPTQHNILMACGNYAGVEVDCYSQGFNQKVQLLVHFRKDKIEKADVFKSMLKHTLKYRSSQLFEFIDTIVRPIEHRLQQAAQESGASELVVEFVKIYVLKIKQLIEQNYTSLPLNMIKNSLLSNFFEYLRPAYGDSLIDRALFFLKAVKKKVKENFSLQYFYRTSEIIEEVRSLGGCIVVPHPEQFWPILLAGYDVDGYEVWNPQSQRYTEFLISVVLDKNKQLGLSKRPLLIFMGDDTHMGEKVKAIKNILKASREIGYQPAWYDLSIQKKLVLHNICKEKVIDEYKQLLDS
ncbi:MAG: hypothetical protein Q9M37_00795 [Desulfonauticus sp.]|nr:hypothetical protein [Desulfonauticus sp.]